MPIPLALLFPLIPSLVENVVRLVSAIRQSPETPDETKKVLEILQARLEDTASAVQALKIYPPPA